MMNRKLQTLKYLLADGTAAASAWSLFYVFRKVYIEPLTYGYKVDLTFGTTFFISLILIPFVWITFYIVTGTYKNIYRKSRLREFGQTFIHSIIGVIFIFFTLLLDDKIASYKYYYTLFAVLFSLHFIFTAFLRLIITTSAARRIHQRQIGFNTIIIGSNEKALKLYLELKNQAKSSGFLIRGFVHINGSKGHLLKDHLPHLGHFKDIDQIIEDKVAEEVIIAIESSEHESIGKIINSLHRKNVFIKVIPDMYDILAGSVKMNSIFGAPLIDIRHEIMPNWQIWFKRIFDTIVSVFALTLLSPLYLFLAIMVKLGSKGPVFYSHERVGRYGKPFRIFKFRSMYADAEKNGPALSSEGDKRITPFGVFMRKSRLDELPQFYNVLIGDMAMVGPRPERQFFIDQIIEQAPHYVHLQKVRPGITSWGQVKYGYAENVEEMVERLKFDIIYIENMSLFIDLKILIYTVLIVLQGQGK